MIKWIFFELTFLGSFFFLPLNLFSQAPAADSSGISLKSTFPDSANQDTIKISPLSPASRDSIPKSTVTTAKTGIDAPVEYSARTIDSRKPEGIIYLIGKAKVKYKDVTIEAGKITIKWNENILIAEGIPDSTNSVDSVATDTSVLKLKDFPVFSDSKEKMVGEQMEYNFKSEKGRIVRGRTEFQKGYYSGDAVKRVDPTAYFVRDGAYSTCDKVEPHFHFHGKKMKVMLNDKVVAKPIIFYLGKIPLAIFPFAMFSTEETGRQSGIILPQYGSSAVEGRYLRNLGYYWATNDYMDMQFTLDFFERTGILFRGNLNYALRYKFNGSVDGSITRKDFETRSERRWNLNINHSQTIDETSSLAVNASFQSNNSFYKEYSNNRGERLNRQIRSNATYRKSWDDGKNSVTLNLSQTKDIESGNETITLPQVQFSRNRSAFFPFEKDETDRSDKEARWYNYLQYDYKGLLTNTIDRDTVSTSPDDVDRRIEHDISLSFTNPDKLFNVLSLNQSFSYNEDWFDRRNNFTLVDSTNKIVEEEEEKGFFTRRTFQYTASANTNLYGTFFPNILSLTAFRHKLSQSVSFSYRPDFSSEKWGYFQTIIDTAGNAIKKDRFRSTPIGKSMSMGFGLTNLFQMKLGKGEKEKKIDLFNLDFRSGYNFAADSLKLSNLSSSFRANPRQNFNVTASMSHSFYEFDQNLNRVVDNLIVPRLINFRADARWTLSGKKTTAQKNVQTATTGEPAEVQQLGPGGPQAGGDYDDRFAPESAFSALDIPWKANISFAYNVSKTTPTNTIKSAYIDLSNVEVQLTKNWRIGYRLRYDLEKTEIVDQRLSFYRDLHCWEARFDWNPSGIGQGYYFIINVKAPHLRQLKYEQRGGTSTIFRPY